MKAISDTLGVARSNLAMQAASGRTRKRRGRRPQPEAALVTEIKTLIAGQPTYGYRRIHALLRCQRREQGGAPVNAQEALMAWYATPRTPDDTAADAGSAVA